MVEIFLDIETVPEYQNREEYNAIKNKIEKGEITDQNSKNEYWKFKNGALNPHEGKIIAVTYSIDDKEKVILKEWESSEKDILFKFNQFIKSLEWPKKMVGVGISHFDIPFIYERMKKLGIDDEYWLYKNYIQSLFQVDLIQTHLHLNDFEGKGVGHNNICSAYGFKPKLNHGSIMAELYYNKKHQEILNYIEQEFVHPLLFKKIKEEGIVNKEEFKKILNPDGGIMIL